jgi:two-component system cell cycle response regulator
MDQPERLDSQSGLFPQKMLELLLIHEVARSHRYPSPLSLIYFAIQWPKDATDRMIESAQLVVANLLHSKLREVDLPGHYEGNYLMILPSTTSAGAKQAAIRLLEELSGTNITRAAEPFEFSISIGVVTHPGGESISSSQLLSNASSALWEAQKRGLRSLAEFEEMQGKSG